MTRPARARAREMLLFAAAALLTGCAVGPNFHAPEAPTVASYTPDSLPATNSTPDITGGDAQRFISGQDIPGQWWELFHSKALDDLIQRSLQANPTLKAAQAALAVARENVLAQKGAYYPSLAGSVSAARQKTSNEVQPTPNSGALYFDLYTPQVSVSFVPDVFGLNRRTVESLRAQAEQARFALVATDIALSANVATAAIQEASLRAQIDATRQLIAINTDMLDMLRTQFAKGYVSQLEVAAQQSQLAQVSATLPPLLKQLAQQRDLLAALSGVFPSEGPAEQFELSALQLPQDLPLTIPSQLVAQRPDVRQAEENLHAASAQVGIAIANRLPNFALTADAGSMALLFSKIFAPGAAFWTLAGSVTQPIFQGGTLRHKQRAAQDAYVEASEQYRGAVLAAFQNVADALAALEQDADALKTAAAAKNAADTTLGLAKRQYQAGYANYLTLLSAEQASQQAVIAVVQAQANRYADTAALFQALGGGWWNRTDLARSGTAPGT
jgi:NodT family efflux transporter outer membrane factor (OMF) lipoprotein